MVADDILGTRRYEAAPLKLDAYDTNICTPRPLMGEHTREVLADLLEFSPQTIDTLIEDEIIFAAPAVRQEAMV